MKYIILVLHLLCIYVRTQSQIIDTLLIKPAYISFSRTYLEQKLTDLLAEGLLTDEEVKLYLERYNTLLTTPLDINSASAEELDDIPLISNYQVYQFVSYRLGQRGRILDVSELKNIEGWEEDFVEYVYPLLKFPSTQEPNYSWSKLSSEGRSQLSVLGVLPIGRTEPEHNYIGSPEALTLKYSWQSHRRISLYVGADKDSYEPWQYGRHRGFDSYHGHIMLRNFANVKQFILGQYRLSWAEGLILGQGFRMRSVFTQGKSSMQRTQASTSSSSSYLSQGVFMRLGLGKHLFFSVLGSSRRIDGKINEEQQLYTLSESALHRTEKDWERRNRISQRHIGCQLAYEQGRWGLSWQGILYDWAGLQLHRAVGAAYNEELGSLKSFQNISLAYRYASLSGRSHLSGEVAMSKNRAFALVQQIEHQNTKWGSLHLGVHYISPNYWAYLGQADTHFARPHNELGLNWGLKPPISIRGLRVQLEGDWFRSIRARRNKIREEGWGLKLNTLYRLNPAWVLTQRISYRSYKQNYSKVLSSLSVLHQYMAWSTELRAEYHRSSKYQGNIAQGYVLSARLKYKMQSKGQVWSTLSYHSTTDWLNRAYAYEPRLSEQYGATLLYGQGIRTTFGFRIQLSEHIKFGINSSLHYRYNLKELRTLIATQLNYRL